MKVILIFLLIGLAVTVSDGKTYSAKRAAPDLNALVVNVLTKGPTAVANQFGIDLATVLNDIGSWVNFLEPHLKPLVVKAKVITIGEILNKLHKVLGFGILKMDFMKLANDVQDKVASAAQLMLSLLKMIAAFLKTVK